MAELKDRMAVEEDFAARLARQSSQHRKELWALIDLVNPKPIPDEFWQKVEEDKKKTMIWLLAATYLASAEQHANAWLPSDLRPSAIETLAATANAWSTQRGSDLAGQYTQTSRERFERATAGWYGPDFETRGVVGEIKPQVSQKQALEDLIDIFGPARDAGIAATETTRAATGGFHGARNEAADLGIQLRVIWHTEADGRVCPYCKPLHGVEMPDWAQTMWAAGLPLAVTSEILRNGGPPAHPNCRCWVETVRGTP